VKKSRLILITVISTIVALSVLSAVVAKFRKPADPPTAVRLETAAKGDLTEYVTASGAIEPKKKVSISARVAARIIDLPFDKGQHVTCGDANANPPVPASVLVRLDAKDLESELHSAQASRDAQAAQIEVQKSTIQSQQANLKKLEASIELARFDYDRAKKLLETKIMSQSDYDQCKCKVDELSADCESSRNSIEGAKKNIDVLTHNLESADAMIAKARDELSYTLITSPIDGTVTQVMAEVGELVVTGTMNNAGTVILEVADMRKMLFVAQVEEGDVLHVRKGQMAKVRLQAFGERQFGGTVDSVALVQTTSQTEGTKYFRTEVLLDDVNDQILSGLTGDTDIETDTHKNVIKVASQAVVGCAVDDLPASVRNAPEVDKNKTITTVVYKFVDGKAAVTPVKIGASDLTHTIITSGLAGGERIVSGPYKVLSSLKHDQKLTEEKADDKAGKKKSADANHA
jgi:HlyD family secretion protein